MRTICHARTGEIILRLSAGSGQMDQKVSAEKFGQKRTEGIKDPMFGKGLGYRIGEAIVD